MYLLYCDESGTVSDPNQKHFVLAGICLFERQGYWFANELDKIAARFNIAESDMVELHGSPMQTGRNSWRKFPKEIRHQAIKDSLSLIASSHHSNRIFACVVKKEKASPKDPVELAFEQLASRFDYFLTRLHKQGDTQRGIIIFDKSTYEGTIQNLAIDFRKIGHSWGVLRNFAEVPLFIDSKASRLTQLSDIVAYSIFRCYEKGDNTYYNIIKDRLDANGGITHGLYELL